MVAKRKKRKYTKKDMSKMPQNIPTAKYVITGGFVWKGVSYNAGSAIPNFMPNELKHELFLQRKLAKIDESGEWIFHRQPKQLNENDIYAIALTPGSLKDWFDGFEIDVESLKTLLAHFKTRNMPAEYIDLIEKEIGKNDKKEEGAGAVRRSDDTHGVEPSGEGVSEPVSQG